MNTDCELCHAKGSYANPYTNTSEGKPGVKGFGCAGCHGKIYSGKIKGPGMRAHHAKKKIVVCAGCHTGDPKPLAENVKPPYYGTSYTAAAFPCNNNSPPGEDWTFDGKGLDNDGDGLRDGADPDCKGCSLPTCASLGKGCGLVQVSCGGTLDCGSCSWPQTCGGGGKPNVCGSPIKADAGVPDAAQLDSSPKPDVAPPDAPAKPDVAQPDVAQLDKSQPDVPQPDVPQPDVAQPDVAQPDVAQPDVAQAPDLPTTDLPQPDKAQPDKAQPDLPGPDVWSVDAPGKLDAGVDAASGPDGPSLDMARDAPTPDKGQPTPDRGQPDLYPAPGPVEEDSGGCHLRTGGAGPWMVLLLVLLALRARRWRRGR